MPRYRKTRKTSRRRSAKGSSISPANQIWRILPAPLERALIASPGGAVFLEALSSLGQ